jgi:hypothetical protein
LQPDIYFFNTLQQAKATNMQPTTKTQSNRRGRPQKQAESLQVYPVKAFLTRQQAELLQRAADMQGVSLSLYIRQAILSAMQSMPKKTHRKNSSPYISPGETDTGSAGVQPV